MRRFKAWAPVILWMVCIFLLSSRSRIQITEEQEINFIIFKLLHMIEYALLYFLSFRAIRFERSKDSSSVWYFSAFVLCVLYAGSDEIHQTFIPTREGRARDVIIDTAGIASSWITIQQFVPILPKKLRNLAKKLLLV